MNFKCCFEVRVAVLRDTRQASLRGAFTRQCAREDICVSSRPAGAKRARGGGRVESVPILASLTCICIRPHTFVKVNSFSTYECSLKIGRFTVRGIRGSGLFLRAWVRTMLSSGPRWCGIFTRRPDSRGEPRRLKALHTSAKIALLTNQKGCGEDR